MDAQILELPLAPKTVIKLKMLAVASGTNYKDLEAEVAELVDAALTEKLHNVLEQLDGCRLERRANDPIGVGAEPPPAESVVVDKTAVYLDAAGKKKTFADLHKEESGGQPIAPAPPAQPDKISGHELSDDDAPEETLSLQEQVEREGAPQPTAAATTNALGETVTAEEAAVFALPISAPAVKDHEDFVDATMTAPPKPAAPAKRVNTQYGEASIAKRGYANQPRVKISGISEEEEEGGKYFF